MESKRESNFEAWSENAIRSTAPTRKPRTRDATRLDASQWRFGSFSTRLPTSFTLQATSLVSSDVSSNLILCCSFEGVFSMVVYGKTRRDGNESRRDGWQQSRSQPLEAVSEKKHVRLS